MLYQQIEKDLQEAMKAKDEQTISVLRMLKSAIHNWQIANQKALTGRQEPSDPDILTIIQKEVKTRKDSIAMYEQGNRAELAQKEKEEIEILTQYLPAQISDDELQTKIKDQINKVGAKGISDMGKVIGPIMNELKGRVDGSKVSAMVKEELAK